MSATAVEMDKAEYQRTLALIAQLLAALVLSRDFLKPGVIRSLSNPDWKPAVNAVDAAIAKALGEK